MLVGDVWHWDRVGWVVASSAVEVLEVASVVDAFVAAGAFVAVDAFAVVGASEVVDAFVVVVVELEAAFVELDPAGHIASVALDVGIADVVVVAGSVED